MAQTVCNRIAGLLDVEVRRPVPVVRTAAQRTASRRNGTLSRGPVTDEGKARSRMSALKHGLLAKQIAPPGDAREHDRLFWKARRELEREFKPGTFSARCAIDALASDFVQAARARAMTEALQRPAPLPAEDLEKWR